MHIAAARAVGSEDAVKAVHDQLARLEDRMVDRYARNGTHPEEVVRTEFRQASDRFTDATVHSFLPILIERRVKAAFS